MSEALLTRATRIAGDDTRHRLHDLRQRLELPPREPQLYPVMNGARPANVIVPLPLGTGHDRAALDKALKLIRRRMDNLGLSRLVFTRDSPLYAARTRSQERRRRALMARRRAAKNARRQRAELRGVSSLGPRRPAFRRDLRKHFPSCGRRPNVVRRPTYGPMTKPSQSLVPSCDDSPDDEPPK